MRVGIAIHVGIADEQLPSGQDQHLHCRERVHAAAKADDLAHKFQVIRIVAAGPAQHRIGITTPNQHRADERRPAAHFVHRLGARDAFAAHQVVVGEAVVAVARVVEDVDAIAVVAEA